MVGTGGELQPAAAVGVDQGDAPRRLPLDRTGLDAEQRRRLGLDEKGGARSEEAEPAARLRRFQDLERAALPDAGRQDGAAQGKVPFGAGQEEAAQAGAGEVQGACGRGRMEVGGGTLRARPFLQGRWPGGLVPRRRRGRDRPRSRGRSCGRPRPGRPRTRRRRGAVPPGRCRSPRRGARRRSRGRGCRPRRPPGRRGGRGAGRGSPPPRAGPGWRGGSARCARAARVRRRPPASRPIPARGRRASGRGSRRRGSPPGCRGKRGGREAGGNARSGGRRRGRGGGHGRRGFCPGKSGVSSLPG